MCHCALFGLLLLHWFSFAAASLGDGERVCYVQPMVRLSQEIPRNAKLRYIILLFDPLAVVPALSSLYNIDHLSFRTNAVTAAHNLASHWLGDADLGPR